MQSDLSVNQFLIRKGMNEYLYTKVDIKEWKKERDQIYARASAKFKTRMVNDIADKYSNYRKLWGGVEKLCEKFINRESELDAVDPMDVARISIAIEKAMKGIRLLDGSSTENVKTENIHLAVVKILEDQQNGEQPELIDA